MSDKEMPQYESFTHKGVVFLPVTAYMYGRGYRKQLAENAVELGEDYIELLQHVGFSYYRYSVWVVHVSDKLDELLEMFREEHEIILDIDVINRYLKSRRQL